MNILMYAYYQNLCIDIENIRKVDVSIQSLNSVLEFTYGFGMVKLCSGILLPSHLKKSTTRQNFKMFSQLTNPKTVQSSF